MVTMHINRNLFFFRLCYHSVASRFASIHPTDWSDKRKMAIFAWHDGREWRETRAERTRTSKCAPPSLITFSIYNVHELCATIQSRQLTNCYGEYAILFFRSPLVAIGLCILSYSIPRWMATANRQRHRQKKSILLFDVRSEYGCDVW